MVNHERSASQFALVAHGCILISLGFMLSQLMVDVKLAQTPSSSVVEHVAYTLCPFRATTWRIDLATGRMVLDVIYVYFGVACFLLLSNHIVEGTRIVWIVTITIVLVIGRMIYFGRMLYNGHDYDEIPSGVKFNMGNLNYPADRAPGTDLELEALGSSGP
ncbi:unnamed protein product [Arabis nemorensis]|uniref:Uncharacterized protein n=1 Tax=Arabis nemorensis TaxID=586526 RepID=A0A565AZM1_9BRAS|nr:unnamed protein product [Arabis nemorensis]